MNNKPTSVSIYSNPLPPDEMHTFVLRLISYDQLISDIASGAIRGTVTLLDQIVNVIVELQYKPGTMVIGSFKLSNEDVAHRLLQAKYYDIELIMRDMTSSKTSRIETDQQLVEALYNTIGSLRSYRHRQRKEQASHKRKG